MKDVNKIQVFNYLDYRQYLKDFYLEKKSLSSFSLNSFAKKTNLTKMAIKFIIDKKRHISENNILNFSKALGLQKNEKKYFFFLVKFNKAKNDVEKKQYFNKILKLNESPIGEYYLKYSEMGIFKEWFYPVIAEMSYLSEFKDDPKWIQNRLAFKVSINEIQEALVYLKYNNFLNGLKSKDFKLKVPDEIKSFFYKKYSMDILNKAKEAIARQNTQNREIFNLTISVNQDKYITAKKMISDFRHKLHDALASSDEDCEKVIQINMQMFTVSALKDRGL